MSYIAPIPDEGVDLNFLILLFNMFAWVEVLSTLERSPGCPIRTALEVNNEMVGFVTDLLRGWGFFD